MVRFFGPPTMYRKTQSLVAMLHNNQKQQSLTNTGNTIVSVSAMLVGYVILLSSIYGICPLANQVASI